jgi:hypothetical protein
MVAYLVLYTFSDLRPGDRRRIDRDRR